MNQTTEKPLPELPAKVAAALTEVLSTLPGGGQARVTADVRGALNHVFFVETPTERCVFRMRRESSASLIFDYLSCIYRYTGFLELGGVFRLRDMPGETAFMRRAQAAGLPVPRLLRDAGDWILMEFIQGRTATSAVESGDLSVVPLVVEALHAAHRQGVIYGDRWGDNELIETEGRVRVIDFDVEWQLLTPQPGLLEALEVAVYLFNSLRLTCDRPGMLALTQQQLVPRLRAWGYDMGRIADIAEGLGRFYLDPNKLRNKWSLSDSLYVDLAAPTAQLVQHLRDAR